MGGEGSERDEHVRWRILVEKHNIKEMGISVISHNGCILFVEFLRKRQKNVQYLSAQ